MKKFLKKQWSNILLLVAIVLLLFPQTSLPIRVFFTRIFMMSPSVETENREAIADYNWQIKNIKSVSKNFKQSDGKVVFINFWATWCPPCVAEMPKIESLYKTYGNKVDFYIVTQENPEVVQRFLEKHNYTFPVYISNEAPPKPIEVLSIPRTLIVSKEKQIVVDETGAANWDDKGVHVLLEELL